MKKSAMLTAAALLWTAGATAQVMKTENGKTTVNTTTLGTNVRGFRGPTPLEVTFKDNKIVSVEALTNQETPSYFERVKKEMLSRFAGLTAKKAAKNSVDGVTGATLSSDAVRENVKLAAEYYTQNKSGSKKKSADAYTGASQQTSGNKK